VGSPFASRAEPAGLIACDGHATRSDWVRFTTAGGAARQSGVDVFERIVAVGETGFPEEPATGSRRYRRWSPASGWCALGVSASMPPRRRSMRGNVRLARENVGSGSGAQITWPSSRSLRSFASDDFVPSMP
jgi:hypothetical protein